MNKDIEDQIIDILKGNDLSVHKATAILKQIIASMHEEQTRKKVAEIL